MVNQHRHTYMTNGFFFGTWSTCMAAFPHPDVYRRAYHPVNALIAMENGPFTDDLPIKMVIFRMFRSLFAGKSAQKMTSHETSHEKSHFPGHFPFNSPWTPMKHPMNSEETPRCGSSWRWPSWSPISSRCLWPGNGRRMGLFLGSKSHRKCGVHWVHPLKLGNQVVFRWLASKSGIDLGKL